MSGPLAPIVQLLPDHPDRPLWLVMGDYTWGKATTLAEAIQNAELEHGDSCIVFRCDPGAYIDEISQAHYNSRSAVYKGTVAGIGVKAESVVREASDE